MWCHLLQHYKDEVHMTSLNAHLWRYHRALTSSICDMHVRSILVIPHYLFGYQKNLPNALQRFVQIAASIVPVQKCFCDACTTHGHDE